MTVVVSGVIKRPTTAIATTTGTGVTGAITTTVGETTVATFGGDIVPTTRPGDRQ